MDDDDIFIPYMNGNEAISVGFVTDSSIIVLKKMLYEVLGTPRAQYKQIAGDTKLISDSLKKSSVLEEEIKNQLKENNKIAKDNLKAQKETTVKTNKSLTDASNKFDKKIDEYKIYSLKFLDLLTKSLTSMGVHQLDMAKTFQDLESSGVVVKSGFDSLHESAARLGMTQQELAKNLKKTSPIIANLNGSMKNGARVFEKSLIKISDDLALTHDEQVAAFESAMEKLTPSQKLAMTEEQLAIQVANTARELKLLSQATGKTVENLKQEQEIKSRELRVKAWAKQHSSAYGQLQSLGLGSDEWIDLIASGGARTNANLVTQIYGDSALKASYHEIMMLANSNRLNAETTAYLQRKYGGLANKRIDETLMNSNNSARYAASSASPYSQNILFNSEFSEALASLNMANAIENEESDIRKGDKKLLKTRQRIAEDSNSVKARYERMKTGDVKTMTESIKVMDVGVGMLNDTMGVLNNTLNNILLLLIGNMGIPFLGKGIKSFIGFNTLERPASGLFDLLSTKKRKETLSAFFGKNIQSNLVKQGFSRQTAGLLAKSGIGLARFGIGAISGVSLLNTIYNAGSMSIEDARLKGTIQGAITGFSIGGPQGGVIGAIVGWGASSIAHIYQTWEKGMTMKDAATKLFDFDKGHGVSSLRNAIRGAVIGFKFGGPLGAVIGLALGGAVGYLGSVWVTGKTGIDWLDNKFAKDTPTPKMASNSSIDSSLSNDNYRNNEEEKELLREMNNNIKSMNENVYQTRIDRTLSNNNAVGMAYAY